MPFILFAWRLPLDKICIWSDDDKISAQTQDEQENYELTEVLRFA